MNQINNSEWFNKQWKSQTAINPIWAWRFSRQKSLSTAYLGKGVPSCWTCGGV